MDARGITRALLPLALFVVACERGPISPSDIPLYDRADWQHWIDADGDCQDTRQEVLIQESQIEVIFDTSGCRVLAGRWRDAYTGSVYVDPGDLDIDHLVPLANAHRSGGWRWNPSRKRDYANDLVEPDQLVAVSASSNRSKGDRGPEAWRPPLREEWCHYAASWRAVKQRWALAVGDDEERALREMCS
jgi:hypothetical protein